jgi:molybdopterin-containing oxidoreductase family membrane subunit
MHFTYVNEFQFPKTVPEAIRGVAGLFHETHITATIWKLSVLGLALSLGFVFYQLMTIGHAAFNTSSDGVTWGSAIAVYAFFALTSSGLSFIAALSTVFGFDDFIPVAKRCIWLAIVALISAFSVLSLELGHPFRMIWAMPTGMQYHSPMFWMGVFYAIDLLLLLVKFYLMWKQDWHSRFSHFIGIAGFVAVILASGMLGLVFGSMAMRPMWFGSGTSLFFMISAAVSGAAALVVTVHLAYGLKVASMPPALHALAHGNALPKVFATLIGLTLVFLLTRLWVGLWTNLDGMEGFVYLLHSPWFHIEVWVCLALPFAMLLMPSLQNNPRAQLVAALLVQIGMFIERQVFILSGQNVPMFKGTWASMVTPYTPSAAEWALVAVGLSVMFLLYSLGERLFDLSALPTPHPSLANASAELQIG